MIVEYTTAGPLSQARAQFVRADKKTSTPKASRKQERQRKVDADIKAMRKRASGK
jgi:hypothetical protein